MDIRYPEPLDAPIRWWPTVYDCISAVAVERIGYGQLYLSAKSLAMSLYGSEQASSLSADTYLQAVANLAEVSRQTILADAIWPGLPQEQIAAFAARLHRAGAQMLLLRDVWPENPGLIRTLSGQGIAVAAVCTAKAAGEHAIDRCLQARAEGACMTGVAGLAAEKLDAFARAVPGPKLLWAECAAQLPDVRKIKAMGYTDALVPFTEKGTEEALMIFGQRTMADRNTVWHDQHDFDGRLQGHDYHDIFDFGTYWLALEDTFYSEQND